ncbi:MAG: HEAT repeat domain-containing protein [Planctomycetales bacterium]|nr:HEAT repeat domain-containing protein [Planctomycetales bacterium]MBN8624115.1 HEAT repeat domain-containing protein [Planctomycetota bacterium]
MRPTKQLLGFAAGECSVIRLAQDRYRVGSGGRRALRLAVELLERAEAGRSLFELRGDIRRIRHQICRAPLAKLVEATPNPHLRRIAIALLGQCGGHVGTQTLRACAGAADVEIRRAAAKSLRRMNEWLALEDFSHDASLQVRRLAAPRGNYDYRARLERYKSRLTPREVSAMHGEVFMSPTIDWKTSRRIRPASLFREILERIRRTVRRLPSGQKPI